MVLKHTCANKLFKSELNSGTLYEQMYTEKDMNFTYIFTSNEAVFE